MPIETRNPHHTAILPAKQRIELFLRHLELLNENPYNVFDIQNLSKQWIFSVSGWRGPVVEHSHHAHLAFRFDPALAYLTLLATYAFSQFVELHINKKPRIALGCDSRWTSPSLALFALLGLNHNHSSDYLGVLPINELVCYTQNSFIGEAFFYISASHNPLTDNGFKFGVTPYGILESKQAEKVKKLFDELLHDAHTNVLLQKILSRGLSTSVSQALKEETQKKAQAAKDYEALCENVLQRKDLQRLNIQETLKKPPNFLQLGLLCDMNSSARTQSIDQHFLQQKGLLYFAINDSLGEFAHQILPEGPGLDLAKRLLKSKHQADPRYYLAYVPDCDGDRGNILTVIDGQVQALQAQELFQLIVFSELCWASICLEKEQRKKLVLVINDATSLRVEAIASCFEVFCHRSEVGEANVNALAFKLKSQGFYPLVLGEGSNGGCIFPPSTVRDPLHMLLSLIRLLSLPLEAYSSFGEAIKEKFSKILSEPASLLPSLPQILYALPAYHSTEVSSDPQARLAFTLPLVTLKRRYHQAFAEDFRKHPSLQKYSSYTEWQHTGTSLQEDPINNLTEDELNRGSYKILLFSSKQELCGFLWFRPSGTEAILRLMVDLQAHTYSALEQKNLFAYHRGLVVRCLHTVGENKE